MKASEVQGLGHGNQKEVSGRTVSAYIRFPMGAKGRWHNGNGRVLRQMGLGAGKLKKVAKILSKMVLLSTIKPVKVIMKLTLGVK